MNATILLMVQAAAVVASLALFVVVARRGGSARFLALCALVALMHLGDVVYYLGRGERSAFVLSHVALTLLSPVLVMVVRPRATRLEIGIVWMATVAAAVSGAILQRSPGIALLAVVLAYLIVERLTARPAGVAARGIVASLVMMEIFVVVVMTSGFRPEFPRLEWWLYAFGGISSIPLLLLLAAERERERLPLADAAIRRGVAAVAVLFWIAVAERWLPAAVIAFASIAIWYAVSRWIGGRLVPQRVVDAGLESQRLLARRMTERDLIDQTCALLRSAFECQVTFDGSEFAFGARHRAFAAGELRIAEGVRDQLVAAIEAEGHRRREYEMRELAARAELSALRAQIQPHFLFNVLNTLAELVRRNPPAAEAMIEQLADIFRYALATTRRDLVPLGEEIEFVRAYLAIEQARFESRLGIELDVPEGCRAVRVPPMTLQPLVENAIRHGVARSVSGGTVSIAVQEHDHGVRIVVSDRSGDRTLDAAGGEGIALENVRARLAGLAGARLNVDAVPFGTVVTIELPA